MLSVLEIIWIVLILRFQMMQRMDGLIAIAIDAGNLTDCAEDAAGGQIAAIDAVISMNCYDMQI